ncbi:hypothetical protein [Clostridium grantii]|uniref:Uncharacterized protein n=1 Tax=Clostridium grantii DSM 8605 TaxID=1121316 RepID=A0A1M5RTH0_9CLOT|nr:hypothetical protein [Clostridium grantii]SHH29133.1 hypothetical protein SAMN02745207_00693 [Clostridium grantii DSM 8605]
MGNRLVVQTYYGDMNNLVTYLNQLVNAYRLLIGSAGDLNGIALAKKSEVKDALKRAEKLGNIIDEVIETIDKTGYCYSDYCKTKSDILKEKIESGFIVTEIEQQLFFKD